GDPAFPLARAALAEALSCLGYDERAHVEAEKAVELSRALPEHFRLETQAKLAEIVRQPDKALDAYGKLFARFPDNFDYGFKLASYQLHSLREGDYKKTVESLRKLPPPAGDSPRLDVLDSYNELIAGDFDGALKLARAAQERADGRGERLVSAGAFMAQARILWKLHKGDEAVAAAGRAREIFEAAGD